MTVRSRVAELGNEIRVSLPPDPDGFVGRQCPAAACKRYFKFTPGTGRSGRTHPHCAYCGASGTTGEFSTPDQRAYAQSIAVQRMTDAFVGDLKELELVAKPLGFGMTLSLRVTAPPPTAPHAYEETALETHVECSMCGLKYAVFGVFAFCPDCAEHNSHQMLEKNLEVAGKMLHAAEGQGPELREMTITSALSATVAAFDGFGRETCRVAGVARVLGKAAENISFQNLDGATKNVAHSFGIDLRAGLDPAEWARVTRGFQKRHLTQHKAGVVDQEYVAKTSDTSTPVGSKIRIDVEEVRDVMILVSKLGSHLFGALHPSRKSGP